MTHPVYSKQRELLQAQIYIPLNIGNSLLENIQREELNPIELAKAFYRLNQDYSLSPFSIQVRNQPRKY
jgi:hypothetical protein